MQTAPAWEARPVTMTAVADLRPHARNARTHSDEQVAQIVASLMEYGWTNPILADEAGRVLAGHGRLLAAAKLGMDAVPVIRVAGLTEAQKTALTLADNKLGLNAGWDLDLLKVELGSLSDLGFDLSLTGFSVPELDAMFGPPPAPPASRKKREPAAHTCPACGHEWAEG